MDGYRKAYSRHLFRLSPESCLACNPEHHYHRLSAVISPRLTGPDYYVRDKVTMRDQERRGGRKAAKEASTADVVASSSS